MTPVDAEISAGTACVTVTITRAQAVRYAGASGDFNPIHYDDDDARGQGHDTAIAPGMLIGGLLAHLLTAAHGPTAIRKMRTRFVHPLALGARLTLRAEPRRLTADGLVVELTASTEDGTVIVAGGAVVAPAPASDASNDVPSGRSLP